MAFDPSADPVVNQTTQGATSNNIKTYHHAMDLFVHQLGADLLAEGRESRSVGRALTARCVDVILGRQISDAAADAVAGNTGLDAGQIGAKIAQTTPPETGVTQYLANLNALFQQQFQQQTQLLGMLQQLVGQSGSAPAGK